MGPAHEARVFAPLAEFDNAVVAEAHHLGDVADGHRSAVRRTGDLQQKLMLLGLQPGGRGGLLAELQEAPNLITEFG